MKKIDKMNPNTAKILSIILPGSGQVYAGDIKSGVNSLALTSAFVYMAYRIALTSTFLDALISAFPWYQRYYMGGYNSAGRITTERKKRKLNTSYESIMDNITTTIN